MAPRTKSSIWLYFSQLEGDPPFRARCLICSRVVCYHAGSKSNLNRHLKNVHSSILILNSDKKDKDSVAENPDLSEATSPEETEQGDAVENLVEQENLPLSPLIEKPERPIRVTNNKTPKIRAKPRRLLTTTQNKEREETMRSYLENALSDDDPLEETYGSKKKVPKLVVINKDGEIVSSGFTVQELSHGNVEISKGFSSGLHKKEVKPDSYLEAAKYETDAKLQIAKDKLEAKKELNISKLALAREKEKNRHDEKMLKLEIIKMKLLQEEKTKE